MVKRFIPCAEAVESLETSSEPDRMVETQWKSDATLSIAHDYFCCIAGFFSLFADNCDEGVEETADYLTNELAKTAFLQS